MIAARMLSCCFFALAAVLFASCQQRSTTPNHVSGKVFYQGQILPGGVIVFSPDTSRGETGKIAIGKIQSDGSYTLQTDDVAGVPAGWYRVSVACLSGQSAVYDSQSISLVPEKYRDPQLSQLQCEVKPNRDNHLDFNLD